MELNSIKYSLLYQYIMVNIFMEENIFEEKYIRFNLRCNHKALKSPFNPNALK